MNAEIFLLTFIPPLILGFVCGQVMEDNSIKTMAINLLGFSICALIAILAFVYIVVPQFNKSLYEQTEYVPVPQGEQKLEINGKVELL